MTGFYGISDKPYVQFVDAWKMTKRTYSGKELAKRYPSTSFTTQVIDS
ncbi:MAG: hypothetical protein P0S95_07600 [Rhabdochlamydiaceae bacterium]|nr:hypothetical protein [Candidatus Amphrikana amoebophyrae]